MPVIEFEEGFKKAASYDYPKLKLKGKEKARISVLDQPTFEYVHQLNKVITENGRPIMETQTFASGRSREVPKTDFLGKYLCLGDLDVLSSKSVDPDNCPACKAAVEHGSAVRNPDRRFAVHVVKYQTQSGTFNIQEPFQVSLLAWEFTEKRFSTLVDIRTEFGSLPSIDLLLGPCTNEGFQQYDVMAGGPAQWAASEDRRQITADVYKNQKSPDLSPLLGRKASAAELRSAVADVVHTWNAAFGIPGVLPTVTEAVSAESLLGDSSASSPAPQGDPAPAETLESLLGEGSAAPQEAAQPAPQAQPETVPAGGIEDIEDLLKGIQ